MPLTMPNPDKAPPMPMAQYLKDVQGVLELRENLRMEGSDWNANVRSLFKRHKLFVLTFRQMSLSGFFVQKALRTDALKAFTNLTPRTLDDKKDTEIPRGRVLPLSSNPRYV